MIGLRVSGALPSKLTQNGFETGEGATNESALLTLRPEKIALDATASKSQLP